MAAQDQQPLGSGFGKDTPAMEVIQGVDLTGKNAIVTGGYSGIGVETVRALASAGAKVVVPARNRSKAEANLKAVEGDITIEDMDLADISSVRAFTKRAAEPLGQLDLLINNAGVMASPLFRVGPGWEGQFGTNHMGHFALTKELMPLLEKAKNSRVVALSSLAHRNSDILWDDINFEQNDYDKWLAYGQAKTANALFAVALDKRMQAFGGRAYSVHPGVIMTNLSRHIPEPEMEAMRDSFPEDRFKSVEAGAATAVWAATAPQLADKGGVYCADGDIGLLVDGEDSPENGVLAHAVDGESAERLWEISEKLLADA